MFARWSFFLFDWRRFEELAPILVAASDAGALDRLEFEERLAILAEFDDDAETPAICNAIVMDICGEGEPVTLDGAVAELIHSLRRSPNGEPAADILGDLVTSHPHVEPWLHADSGLIGILAPDGVLELSAAFASFRRTYSPPPGPRGLAAIARRLTASEAPIDHLADLLQLADLAAARGMGIAVSKET